LTSFEGYRHKNTKIYRAALENIIYFESNENALTYKGIALDTFFSLQNVTAGKNV